jgi:hypothetical protein
MFERLSLQVRSIIDIFERLRLNYSSELFADNTYAGGNLFYAIPTSSRANYLVSSPGI